MDGWMDGWTNGSVRRTMYTYLYVCVHSTSYLVLVHVHSTFTTNVYICTYVQTLCMRSHGAAYVVLCTMYYVLCTMYYVHMHMCVHVRACVRAGTRYIPRMYYEVCTVL